MTSDGAGLAKMALPGYMRWLPDAALKKLGRIEFLAHGTVDGFIAGRHKIGRAHV